MWRRTPNVSVHDGAVAEMDQVTVGEFEPWTSVNPDVEGFEWTVEPAGATELAFLPSFE
jgi:hypothetical protein